MKDRKVKQVLSGGWDEWDRGGYSEGEEEEKWCKYYVFMYENRTRPIQTFKKEERTVKGEKCRAESN
jgi:hypothetical protein